MKKIVAATAAVLVTASGCSAIGGLTGAVSSGTPSPSFTPQEQTAITSLTTAFSSGKLTISTDSTKAACIATDLVSKLGTEKLQSYKVIRANMAATKKVFGVVPMSVADANLAADAVINCTDPLTAVKEITAGAGMKKKQINCLATKLSADGLKLMFVSYLDQQPSLDKLVTKPLRQCS